MQKRLDQVPSFCLTFFRSLCHFQNHPGAHISLPNHPEAQSTQIPYESIDGTPKTLPFHSPVHSEPSKRTKDPKEIPKEPKMGQSQRSSPIQRIEKRPQSKNSDRSITVCAWDRAKRQMQSKRAEPIAFDCAIVSFRLCDFFLVLHWATERPVRCQLSCEKDPNQKKVKKIPKNWRKKIFKWKIRRIFCSLWVRTKVPSSPRVLSESNDCVRIRYDALLLGIPVPRWVPPVFFGFSSEICDFECPLTFQGPNTLAIA